MVIVAMATVTGTPITAAMICFPGGMVAIMAIAIAQGTYPVMDTSAIPIFIAQTPTTKAITLIGDEMIIGMINSPTANIPMVAMVAAMFAIVTGKPSVVFTGDARQLFQPWYASTLPQKTMKKPVRKPLCGMCTRL